MVLLSTPILLFAMYGGRSAALPSPCRRDAPVRGVVEGLSAEQMAVATQIVNAVRAFKPTANKPHAAVIALATARQESGIRNIEYGDRDSLGAFQQRPSQGWGTPAQVTNVPHATKSFLQHLILVPGWETRRVTDVAADVQRPAEEYRGLYEQWVPLATELTRRLWGSATYPTADPTCGDRAPDAPGGVGYPVPQVFIGSDQRNWGGSGIHWNSWHTGTDFSVPCGTPVLAANPGRIEIDTSQSWAGRWLVKIVTGTSSVATWYAHMQQIDVSAGQAVRSGQKIGRAGALGNATGCHLHFEVHLKNGSIYGPDNANPSHWLQQTTSRDSSQ
jgi:murein DD-endopeptidase MepM/ murein hydrolase activator NlpD